MSLENKIQIIQEKINLATTKSGRPEGAVRMLAVSKTFPAGFIRKAFECGVQSFAENYMQEAIAKQDELSEYNIDWHFIGHLQTNKVRQAVGRFSLLHSVDSSRLLAEIAKRSTSVQKILLEVNLAEEKTKSGCPLAEFPRLLEEAQAHSQILLSGLMFMAPLDLNLAQQEAYYERAFEFREKWMSSIRAPHSLIELSMGTSHDFEVAIRHGATIVRLGSILFGERSK